MLLALIPSALWSTVCLTSVLLSYFINYATTQLHILCQLQNTPSAVLNIAYSIHPSSTLKSYSIIHCNPSNANASVLYNMLSQCPFLSTQPPYFFIPTTTCPSIFSSLHLTLIYNNTKCEHSPATLLRLLSVYLSAAWVHPQYYTFTLCYTGGHHSSPSPHT
jgi:hypothetical protein